MQWQGDPEIQRALRERQVRNGILRSAILWTPFFATLAVLLVFFFIDRIIGPDHGSTWFLIVVLTIGTVIVGSQSLQALFDLFQGPRTTEGTVTRRWSRNDALVMRSHYLRVGKAILRGDVDIIRDVKAGDTVEVRYYPHSAVIVELEKKPEPVASSSQP